jgi:uncharacterized membrane protein
MSSAQQSVDVSVGVKIAYAQWARFDSYPQWMEGVASIDELADGRLHWVAKVKDEVATAENQIREWDARITEQIPDRRISWESVGGRPDEKPNAGRVSFEPLGTSACRVTFGIEWEPEAGLEANEAYVLSAVSQVLAADLARFKDLIEARATQARAGSGELAA